MPVMHNKVSAYKCRKKGGTASSSRPLRGMEMGVWYHFF